MRLGNMLKRVNPNEVGLHELTDDELHEEQKVLVSAMHDVACVCEKYHISWSLFGGSVLGCVRHKGFIPWDDDIDIYMTRQNYEKFKKIFNKDLSEKYELKEPGDKDYLMHYPQIYIKGTTAQLIQSINNAENCLFIDVFILENTYHNRLLRFIHGVECTAYLFIDSVMRTDLCKDNLLKYSDDEQLKRGLRLRMLFARFFKYRSMEDWLKRSDRCFSKVKNNHSKYVVAPAGLKHYFGEIYERNKMCTLVKKPFETEEFYIMSDYNYYLSKRYGSDYMIIPPKDQQEKHVYIKFDLGDAII